MADNLQKIGVRAVVEDLAKYQQDLDKLGRATKDAGGELERAGGHASGFGRQMASMAGGMVAAEVGMRALKTAASGTVGAFVSFQQGIANAGSVAEASAEEMKQMSAAALQIGKDTKFTATEATLAFEEMAAAGTSVTDIINGGAAAAANLAAAGGVDLPLAADVMSTSMTVFGVTADGAADAANRLAGAANVSRFAVEDMAGAVAQGGGAARTAGVSFSDFTTAIAAIAPNFSSGSDAGTSFKTFLLRLNPETDKAKEAMAALGLYTEETGSAFFNANGTMKSMSEVAQLLHDKIGPLTQAQKLSALQTIFGTDALRAAAAMAEITGDQFQAMSDKMGNTSAAEVAAARIDTLGGKMSVLKSSTEVAAIQLTEKLAPAMEAGVTGVTGMVNAFAGLPSSTQSLIGLTVAATAGVAPMLKLGGAIADAVANVREKGVPAWGKWAGAIGGAMLAITALDFALQKLTGQGITGWLSNAKHKAEELAESVERLKSELAGLGESIDKGGFLIERMSTKSEQLADITARLTKEGGALGAQFSLGAEETKRLVAAQEDLTNDMKTYGEELAKTEPSVVKLMLAHNELTGAAQATFDEAVNLEAKWKAYAPVIDDAAAGVENAVEKQLAHTKAVRENADAVEAQAKALEDDDPMWLKEIKSIEDTEDQMKALSDAIDVLIGRFAELNPQVIAAQTENAILTEELEDLKLKGDNLTESERARIAVIEDSIAANDLLIKGYDDNQTAVEATRKAIESLSGKEGYGILLDKLATSSLSLEEQTDTLGAVAGAYVTLQRDGIGAAIGGMETLREKLGGQSEAWKAIAEAIGPSFMAAINSSITDPNQRQMLIDYMESLGFNVAQSLGEGIARGKIIAEMHARELAEGVINAAGTGFVTSSPSKVMIEMGQFVAEGLAIGISNNKPKVMAEVTDLANKALGLLEAGLDPAKGSEAAKRLMEAVALTIQGEGAKAAAMLKGVIADMNKASADAVAATGWGGTAPSGIGKNPPGAGGIDFANMSQAEKERWIQQLGGDPSLVYGGNMKPTKWTAPDGSKVDVYGVASGWSTGDPRRDSWLDNGLPGETYENYIARTSAPVARGGSGGVPIRQYARGTFLVGSTGAAILHRGEAVIPSTAADFVRAAVEEYQKRWEYEHGGDPGTPEVPPPGGGGGGPDKPIFGSGYDKTKVMQADADHYWASSPREMLGDPYAAAGGSGAVEMTFDFRGANLTGSIEENERMLKRLVLEVVEDGATRGSYLAGRKVGG